MAALTRSTRAGEAWLRRCRARVHGLDRAVPHDAAAIVGHLLAVQAQDYPAASWALGLRSSTLTQAAVDRALDDASILRTHVLRPTWHFVTPGDIRSLLRLTGPRVQAGYAGMRRRLELDAALLSRSRLILERALATGPLTRRDLAGALARGRVTASGVRLALVLMHAELDGLIASGPRRGRDFTYALLEQRAAPAPETPRDEALAALVARYLRSHGPATVRDLSWWSGLTGREIRGAIVSLGPAVTRTAVGDLEYWHGPDLEPAAADPDVWLLPNYDEYVVAYRDRGATIAEDGADGILRRTGAHAHPLVAGGRVAGSWARTPSRGGAEVTVAATRPLPPAMRTRLRQAVARYSRFLEVPLALGPRGVF